MLSEAAELQMPKCLNLATAAAVAFIVVGCAEQSTVQKPLAAVEHANSHLGRMTNVRTTAYTRVEEGGRKNALGTYLSGRRVMSAASDWSRFPLGTRFRICSTREEYIIDDYGTALVGSNTIDLYKPTKLEMKRWGVRNVDIDILQWGSEEKSAEVLGPRAKHPQVQMMLAALQTKTLSTPIPWKKTEADKKVAKNVKKASTQPGKKVASSAKKSGAKSAKKVASTSNQSSAKTPTSKQTSAKNSSSRTLD